MSVNIPHIDQHIWNAEQRTIEIIAELQRTGHCDIYIDGEGSDCECLGLYRILDQICSSLGYRADQFTITTLNQLERSDRYALRILPPLYVDSGQEFLRHNPPQPKQITRTFGCFIGRSNWRRLWMASWLYRHYPDRKSVV